MYRPGLAAEIQNTHRAIQSMARIPLLLAANTEHGGDGLAFEGTSFGQPMAVAATDDPENAYRMGFTACVGDASRSGVGDYNMGSVAELLQLLPKNRKRSLDNLYRGK